MLAGTIFFGVEALLTNLLHPLGYHPDNIWDDIGFLVFLSSAGLCRLAAGLRQRAPPVVH